MSERTTPRGARPINVGLVGVSAERGWAALAHVPALRALPASAPDGLPANVAEAYAAIAETWPEPNRQVASFEDAVLRHRMLAAVEEAAQSGRRTRCRPSAAFSNVPRP